MGRRCSGRGNSTNGDVIPHHSSNQQIFTEKVPCAVNRRHGSASRSVLSSGDERPRKQIMSKRTVKITMEGLIGWHRVRGRASNPDSLPAWLKGSLHLETPAACFKVLSLGSSLSWCHLFWHCNLVFRVAPQNTCLILCYSPALTLPMPGAPGVLTYLVLRTSELRQCVKTAILPKTQRASGSSLLFPNQWHCLTWQLGRNATSQTLVRPTVLTGSTGD